MTDKTDDDFDVRNLAKRATKKEWHSPRITRLSIKEAKNGPKKWYVEVDIWFIHTHS
jgi:hypothetical protein